MKKPLLLLTLAFVLLAGLKPAAAQNMKGQSTVTGGVGFSLAGLLFRAIDNAADDAISNFEMKSTPGMLLHYDYGLADRFSIGAAFSYQQFKLVYTNMPYTTTAGYEDTASWDDKVKRINFGIRPLFHFGNNEDLDMYTGVRISMTQWSFSSSHPDPLYDDGDFYDSFNSTIRFQALFGLRYYFTPNIGFNTEFAIGTPYFLSLGANFRFPAS